MDDTDIIEECIDIIDELVNLPYSEIFQIAPAERDLEEIHQQAPHLAEPLIGLMFCAIMQGHKEKAIALGNQVWNIGGELFDNFEMLYVDCLINVGEFEKAQTLISSRMDDIEENLDTFYSALVKYALCTGDLYILHNLASDEKIYMSDQELFDFAEKNYDGLANKHYKAILKIIYDTVYPVLCVTEFLNHPDGGIQFCLYTSANIEENAKYQNLIYEKINGYYASMQEENDNSIHVRIENVNLHPEWW